MSLSNSDLLASSNEPSQANSPDSPIITFSGFSADQPDVVKKFIRIILHHGGPAYITGLQCFSGLSPTVIENYPQISVSQMKALYLWRKHSQDIESSVDFIHSHLAEYNRTVSCSIYHQTTVLTPRIGTCFVITMMLGLLAYLETINSPLAIILAQRTNQENLEIVHQCIHVKRPYYKLDYRHVSVVSVDGGNCDFDHIPLFKSLLVLPE